MTLGNWFRVRQAHRFADVVVGAPYTSHFAPAAQVNIFAIGLPQTISEESVNQAASHRKKVGRGQQIVRALHAPSDPAAKGTRLIRDAICDLRQDGLAIDYVELIGVSNSTVLDEIRRCDFVIDQVFSDTPLAGFAAEAARFGRPAVVGGYGLEPLERFVPQGMFPPSVICHPEAVRDAIRAVATDEELRRRVGRQAHEFVTKQWRAEVVARRYLSLIDGDFPAEWLFDPSDVTYLYGIGQSVEDTARILERYVSRFGLGPLLLCSRKDLKDGLAALLRND